MDLELGLRMLLVWVHSAFRMFRVLNYLSWFEGKDEEKDLTTG